MTPRRPPRLHEYQFTLTIEPGEGDVLDRLRAAGCKDGLPWSGYGLSHIDFAREATDMDSAVMSAVADVKRVEGIRIKDCWTIGGRERYLLPSSVVGRRR